MARVERRVPGAVAGLEELVEHLLPGGAMNLGRLGENPVEIEQTGTDAIRKTKHRTHS